MVRLQVKRFMRRPEWVFGYEPTQMAWYMTPEQRWKYSIGDKEPSPGWQAGLVFRSAGDGTVHPLSHEVNEVYYAHQRNQVLKADADLALNKFLELDGLLVEHRGELE